MNKRSPGLDLLRTAAILLVILRHGDISALTTKIGWVGVDLFFVLSGFLVSGLLFQEYIKTDHLRGGLFLIRRGFKIYPTFWFALLAYIFYFLYKGYAVRLPDVLTELFFIQNFREGIMGISWSLAVEEHFYILLTILAVIAARKRWLGNGRIVLRFCLSVFIFCFLLRVLVNIFLPFNLWTHFFPTYLRIDSLMFGVLIAWFYHFQHARFIEAVAKYRYLIVFFILLGCAMPFIFASDSVVMDTIGFTLLYLGFGGLLCLTQVSTDMFKSRFYQPFIYIGRYSYSIYLMHVLCGPAVANFFRVHVFSAPYLEWVNQIIYVLSDIGIGILVGLMVERPFLNLRDRYFPKVVKRAPVGEEDYTKRSQ